MLDCAKSNQFGVFVINTHMDTRKYYIAMAKNLTTGRTVKNQDLDGHKETRKQFADFAAQALAKKMNSRGTDKWIPIVQLHPRTTRK